MICFGWFYGVSTIVGYLMPNPLYTYILIIYDLVWLVLWRINYCRLFNAKSSLYIYIKYIWFGLVGFYGISTIVGYLIPNPLYTYILNIYGLVWLVLWHINHCRLFNAKSFSYIYILDIWFILQITFLNQPELIFFFTQLNGFTHFYQIQIILFTINHLYTV